MNTPEGFMTDAKTMELFFRYCIRYKVNGEKDRLALLRRLVAKKKAKYLPNPLEYVKGKNVLDLRHKNDDRHLS